MVVAATPQAARAATVPERFRDKAVITGLTLPTTVRFSPDGRVFVAEKSGIMKVYEGLSDPTPEVFADLRANVYTFWDRGLLGLALDPGFPETPYVYVLYTYDAPIDGTAPTWNDACPTPPGSTAGGCVASGRLSRLHVEGNTTTEEDVLIEDWCQQFPSHSIGALAFAGDGALYASGGDGASFHYADYGQEGNPCGDPPVAAGGVQTAPTAEGGALRSQDLQTPDDPVGLDGTVIRVDPATGAGLPDNPLAESTDANARRIVANGLRNPFRFTVRPGTNELWIGDVSWYGPEEINVARATDGVVENFGWPCFDGFPAQVLYRDIGLDLCNRLYDAPGGVAGPWLEYYSSTEVVAGDGCGGGLTTSGVAFYGSGDYPARYERALFFTDYSRQCIWAAPAGPGGVPDKTQRHLFASGVPSPVDLQIGPGGDLFYVDLNGGAIHRVSYFEAAQPPTARISADATSGPPPLTVAFDASESSDLDLDEVLTYEWDLDGDGAYDDSTVVKPTFTYTESAIVIVRLRVTDAYRLTDTASIAITAAAPPEAVIDSPAPALKWKVGDVISLAGSAIDPDDGDLPDSAFSWSVLLHHCTSACHLHTVETLTGRATSFVAIDHEYPSHLEIRLTVTDALGATDSASVLLEPQTVELSFESEPSDIELLVGAASGTTPFVRTVIAGSTVSLSAPESVLRSTGTYSFFSWSDGGPRTHEIHAPESPATYRATLNAHPTASIVASPSRGAAPLRVRVGGGGSTDPDADELAYAWDLDGDGAYDDSASRAATSLYLVPGDRRIGLLVTDARGASASAATTVRVRGYRPRIRARRVTFTAVRSPAGLRVLIGARLRVCDDSTHRVRIRARLTTTAANGRMIDRASGFALTPGSARGCAWFDLAWHLRRPAGDLTGSLLQLRARDAAGNWSDPIVRRWPDRASPRY